MTRKQKRAAGLAAMVAVVAAAAGLVLTALSDSVAFFNSPTDIVARAPGDGQRIRLGGLVETGSVERDGNTVRFRVTDTVESVAVTYTGLLPDLFREGQGVVTEGLLGADRVFAADTVLAKHDETYMPKEIVDDMKARGIWQEGEPLPPASTVRGAGS
ncbi:cytochrome c maturation protein CcmE [Aureimonas altamirensis]|jgi:cytochrome c-type biogenesis protein CcmE|uniref:Cytochrome c-type biogenesis protein CcmE n=1 Tax=Aureimonas altamirensis DSM 21988 TaxID=1121026 RepID=A0ABY1I2X3_9HYPH|nr:cytochrome c maturation protein CcmE [Aureimonas altamirensis]UHD44848.1 cytochrome c maturation protein CcmE [Aureimonas altamirensis]SHI52337.1 cytochrome c-type biogenesis protein CcmE [Aureimonas altamirensis DSM 21988]